MTVSIAMCTYNGGRYLNQQLDSIGRQTLPPYELVICDDGSSDETEEIVHRFRASVSFPVLFSRNAHNLGSTRNFEQAIRLCRGELIALCDQDDAWNPDKLASLTAVLDSNPQLAAVFSNAGLIDEQGAPQPGDLWQRLGFTSARQNAFCRQTAFEQLIQRDTVTGATLLFRSSYTALLVPMPAEWVHDGWMALLLAAVSEIRPVSALPMSYRLHRQQQVGATQTGWTEHLSTRKQAAMAFHVSQAARFQLLLERLEQIVSTQDGQYRVDSVLLAQVKRKIGFFQTRAFLLDRTRLRRLLMAPSILSEYRLYEKGVLSLLRDLMH